MVSRIGATKDQMIVVVASPVFKNSTFTGVLGSSVKVQPLVERFFGMMKVSDQTVVYLVDEGGDLIYSNSDVDVLSDQTLSDRIKKALSSEEEGQFTTDKYLVAYSPLTLGVQKWLLIVSSPVQEAAEQTIPFYIRQTIMFIVTSLIILLVIIVAFRKSQA